MIFHKDEVHEHPLDAVQLIRCENYDMCHIQSEDRTKFVVITTESRVVPTKDLKDTQTKLTVRALCRKCHEDGYQL